MTLPPEFDRIARHFRPLAGVGALNLTDDAAVFAPPPGRELVIAADAMVQGVHFLPSDPPDLIARKLLRTNLSDLAAMGATPLGYLTTISVPRDTPDDWFAGFAAGLAQDQAEFGLNVLGGDCTSTPGPISLSLTILGHVAPGHAVLRSGAQVGDGIWVSGTIGDGALGLLAARGEVVDESGYLADRYHLPRPRMGLARHDLVRACMDVSDGLVQDLGHLCRASGVGAEIWVASVPLSEPARQLNQPELCLTGGDDYELLMAIAPAHEAAFLAHATSRNIRLTRIGHFAAGPADVRVIGTNDLPLKLSRGGWSHF
jgi:thiamine-monophosphate kinase